MPSILWKNKDVYDGQGGGSFLSFIPGSSAVRFQLLLNSPSSPPLSHHHPILGAILDSA